MRKNHCSKIGQDKLRKQFILCLRILSKTRFLEKIFFRGKYYNKKNIFEKKNP